MKIVEPDWDYWLKLGVWNSKQAACIFNNIDPIEAGSKVSFPYEIEDNHRLNEEEWQRQVYRTYTIIETADKASWQKYVNIEPSVYFYYGRPKKTSPHIFISFAVDNRLKIPDVLREWLVKTSIEQSPRNGNVIKTGSVEKQKTATKTTLALFEQIIDDFESSDIFKKYGREIKQNLIEDWLKDKVDTRDKIRTLKELITNHYDITSSYK